MGLESCYEPVGREDGRTHGQGVGTSSTKHPGIQSVLYVVGGAMYTASVAMRQAGDSTPATPQQGKKKPQRSRERTGRRERSAVQGMGFRARCRRTETVPTTAQEKSAKGWGFSLTGRVERALIGVRRGAGGGNDSEQGHCAPNLALAAARRVAIAASFQPASGPPHLISAVAFLGLGMMQPFHCSIA